VIVEQGIVALLQFQKRPAIEAKETYYRGKRDLVVIVEQGIVAPHLVQWISKREREREKERERARARARARASESERAREREREMDVG
jgi:hypothetical protein